MARLLHIKLAKGVNDMKREILFGMLWGFVLSLLIVALFYSVSSSAETGIGGDMEIIISGDSVWVNLEREGNIESVVVTGDSLVRNPGGIAVTSAFFIESGVLFIDGEELSEAELERLKITQERRIDSDWDEDEDGPRIQVRRKRLATIYRDRGGDIVSFHDIVIDSAASIRGDVVSLGGDVTVFGRVIGDIVSVFGDVHLAEGARIRGDVTAPFGQVIRDRGVQVRGDIVIGDETMRGRHDAEFIGIFRFNRVEGLTLGGTLAYDDSRNRFPSVSAGGAYAFSLKRWQYRLGARHRFGSRLGPYFDLNMFQQAETSDRWLLTSGANTFKALIFTEDAFDFYWARGFTGEVGVFCGVQFETGLMMNALRISNLSRNTEDGIFGGKKDFRENWSSILPDSGDLQALKGNLKEYGLRTCYDSRDDERRPRTGLFTELRLLTTADSDSGDFSYSLAHYEIKGYIPVGRGQTIGLRVRAGHSDDRLPLFRRFFLGGIGSLRGYGHKEYQGNRYVLMNADYIWQFHPSGVGAGVFLDAGKVAYGQDAFESADVKTGVGICLLLGDAIRIDLAQRLDDLDRGPIASFRFDLLL
jgi:hypothetical protein